MSGSSHDTRGNIRLREFLSFVLFLLIVLLSISVCGKSVFVNAKYIEEKLNSYSYAASYKDDISQYTEDIFIKNGIPADNIKNIVTLKTAQNLTESYINCVIKVKTGYTAETVSQNIEDLQTELKKEIKRQLENTDYEYDDDTAQKIVEKIGSYANNRLTVPASQYLETLLNVAPVVFTVLLVLTSVFCAVLALIIYFVGAKRYRSVRAIGISFLSAGLFDLILSVIVVIISSVKTVDIYPLYLREAFMSYINGSVLAVVMAGAVLLLISLVLITCVWKMKRNEK